MPKFHKKPIVVEVVQMVHEATLHTTSEEGDLHGSIGDWLITEGEGKQYFCKDSVFRAIYEPVEESQ